MSAVEALEGMFCFRYTFQLQNLHLVCFYNFCLFIGVLYVLPHCRQSFLYSFNHGFS